MLLSKEIESRFCLDLSVKWQDWFDGDWQRDLGLGLFRNPLSPAELLSDRPEPIWPGFMPPDTLPLLGNEYGDWICVRITPDGQLGELIHWYHGGGDWIPVGNSMAEAMLHDAIDQARPATIQMLRGAAELFVPGQGSDVLQRLAQPQRRTWFIASLAERLQMESTPVAELWDSVLQKLSSSDYWGALGLLSRYRLAEDAVACDRIEHLLQGDVSALADQKLAAAVGVPWTPDYTRILFDCELAPATLRDELLRRSGLGRWPKQQWSVAEKIALDVTGRRHDLAWANDIAGWACQRVGHAPEAIARFWAGRHASAYSDQAVRIRSHWKASSLKFSISQLIELKQQLAPDKRSEGYLEVCREGSVSKISEYWFRLGDQALAERQYQEAYCYFYRSGWDVGVASRCDYARILQSLAEAAERAGYAALAQVTRLHLHCHKRH